MLRLVTPSLLLCILFFFIFTIDTIKATSIQPDHDSNTNNQNLVLWPWSYGNSSSSDNDDDNNKNDTYNNACHTHTNCTSCVESSVFCHWCTFDSQCHAVGSIHGCAVGASCSNNNDDDNNNNNNDSSDACSTHSDCTECTLSSNLCHWCAFDDQCHTIGSWFGCSYGVNCFNNDRCKRIQPEKINCNILDSNGNSDCGEGILDDVGIFPLVVIAFISLLTFGCCSVCFVGARAVKLTYDDWAAVAYANISSDNTVVDGFHYEILDNGVDEDGDDEEERGGEGNEQINKNDTKQHLDHEEGSKDEDSDSNDDNNNNDDDNSGHDPLTEKLLPKSSTSQSSEEDEEDLSNNRQRPLVTAHPSINRLPTSSSINGIPSTPATSRKLKCLYNTCLFWYIISIMCTVLFTFGSIYYFPKVPEFNVCSDEFAWNSIIDSLTHLQVEASFQVLSSVKNRNHLAIVLDGVNGSFRHNGEDVGTFKMQTVTIESDSITDVLVTCSVRPDRWEALGLITDYYRGKLEFLINVNGNVKVKGIGYTFPIVLKDVLVPINNQNTDDRHLCHCPQWKDLHPTVAPKLSFEEAVEKDMMPR